MKIQAELPVFQ